MKAILALVSIIYLEASSKSEPANLCNKFLNSDIRKKMIILNKPNKKISVDINNDGVEDIVYLQNTHSLQRSGRYLIIDNNSSYLPEINEELEPPRAVSVIYFNKVFYTLNSATHPNEFPSYIGKITKTSGENKEKLICKFKTKKELTLDFYDKKYGANECNSLIENIKKEDVIPFNIESKFAAPKNIKVTNKDFFHVTKLDAKNLAYIPHSVGYLDYNNDGVKEYLQKFVYFYDSEKLFFVPLNSNRNSFDPNRPTALIEDGWFNHNNKIYAYRGNLKDAGRKIIIDIYKGSNTAKKICEYSYKLKNISIY